MQTLSSWFPNSILLGFDISDSILLQTASTGPMTLAPSRQGASLWRWMGPGFIIHSYVSGVPPQVSCRNLTCRLRLRLDSGGSRSLTLHVHVPAVPARRWEETHTWSFWRRVHPRAVSFCLSPAPCLDFCTQILNWVQTKIHKEGLVSLGLVSSWPDPSCLCREQGAHSALLGLITVTPREKILMSELLIFLQLIFIPCTRLSNKLALTCDDITPSYMPCFYQAHLFLKEGEMGRLSFLIISNIINTEAVDKSQDS